VAGEMIDTQHLTVSFSDENQKAITMMTALSDNPLPAP
jgi:hypothetical protein